MHMSNLLCLCYAEGDVAYGCTTGMVHLLEPDCESVNVPCGLVLCWHLSFYTM